MFNSPLNYCPVCRQYVALDQSRRECAREHGCLPQQPCPLAHLFSVSDRGISAPSKRANEAPTSTTGAEAATSGR